MTRLDTRELAARFYLNGFPKSGLHLLAQMMYPIAHQMPPDWLEAPWVGMFQKQSFTDERAPINQITFGLARIQEGRYMKGHCGWDKALEDYLYYSGIIHIFIYRDLRDVAVSQTYHILNADNKKLFHPDKELFTNLGDFDEILSAVIQGIDIYPGVVDRWEPYAGWLNVDWTLSMKFSVIRNEPITVSKIIIQHMISRLTKILRMGAKIEEEKLKGVVVAMSQAGKMRSRSPTFRKGKVGSWKEHFTEVHVEQFKETDKANWLLKLGFEKELDWHA